MASPYPKPTGQKELLGTRRSDREAPNMVAIEPSLPKPPASVKGEALKEYKRIGELLLAQRVMTALDRNILIRYAKCHARYVEAEEMIEKEGTQFQLSKNGWAGPSQWAQQRDAASAEMLKLEIQLGLTPSARTRVSAISTPTKAEQSEFEAPTAAPPVFGIGTGDQKSVTVQ